MKKEFLILQSLVLGMALLVAQPLVADRPISARGQDRIVREVRHELLLLPYYSVFDNLQYQVKGEVVTLMGQVTRPTLKSDAERVVENIEGVSRVVNRIEVLPLSPGDDEIRMAVYKALFSGNGPLFRYSIGSQSPIHIIVKNGHVTLTGVVDNPGDKTIATMRAKQVPGIFSVTDRLEVRREG
ncbi:MAG: BON domain-containing protein [Acidobacteria bacterium]|nr:BON domain-containing protein [Acidobacteriota bacterium]